MKVFIISDMEGVAGIVKWQQTSGGDGAAYQEGRRLYTEEMNAAVRGARAAGATEVVVMDCHGAGKGWSFNSLVPDLLEPDCEYVVQERWTGYTAFLESGCDAALGSRAGVLADEQRRVAALLEHLGVLGPLVLHDELAALVERLDPVRRQLLGWATSAIGHWIPTDEDVPLRDAIENGACASTSSATWRASPGS